MYTITFQPSGRILQAEPDATFAQLAERAGLPLNTPCGAGGTCGKCRIRIISGTTSGARSAHRLSPEEMSEGWRLACCTYPQSDAVVDVPRTSMLNRQDLSILTDDAGHSLPFAPALRIRSIKLPPPSSEDPRPDLDRLAEALGVYPVPAPHLHAEMSRKLRTLDWHVRCVMLGPRLLDLLPSDGQNDCFGIAFDIGTTTLVGALIDFETGIVRDVRGCMNGQIPFGDDVLARLQVIRTDAAQLPALQRAVADSMNTIIESLCTECGVAPRAVYEIIFAGNTAMQQILLGFDPSPLGELPFTPAFSKTFAKLATELGLRVHPSAVASSFPQVGGFVGGDTLACMLAAGYDTLTKPTLLIDIGTNGEIALCANGRILCASAAAGPAFEGARISQGMRAATGAIDKIWFQNNDLQHTVIGRKPPVGLCGTALIDAAAELLRLGLIDSTGRIADADELPANTPEQLVRRLHPGERGNQIVLAWAADGTTPAVTLTQQDVRELQLASAAIRAGAETLLERIGLAFFDLDTVLLAGAFGCYIRRENARRIGLLPPVPLDRIRFIGNASLTGAKMAMINAQAQQRTESIRARAVHVDLASAPHFQTAYAEAMLFPEH